MAGIRSYKELRVYQAAMDSAMRVVDLTRKFPSEVRFSMVDQMRRSSRSACANVAEAWRKRRYQARFVSKPSDAGSEAEETRVWIEFAARCQYFPQARADELDDGYDKITGQLVRVLTEPEQWLRR